MDSKPPESDASAASGGEIGQVQKCLEIEVDRLFRLKEFKDRCIRVSPIQTLREKEQVKIVNGYQPGEQLTDYKKMLEDVASK